MIRPFGALDERFARFNRLIACAVATLALMVLCGASALQGLQMFGLWGVGVTFAPAPAPVPCPASVWLLATGLAGLLGAGLVRRHRTVAPGGLLPTAAC